MVDFPEPPLPASRVIPIDGRIQRVVLTGFMGAGKSTVGRLLADVTGWDFVDLDLQVEETAGKNARELFDALGETGFRQLETDLWTSVLQRSQTIIAPGGAVIDKLENQRILTGSAGTFIVFLDAPFPILIDRCLRQQQEEGATYRPLLHKTEVAQARYMERRVLYAQYAHKAIDVADKTPDAIVQDIRQVMSAMN